ncbi:DciA family protein [Streptomyces mirabilis]|uniref:DciA family protein n=1 Tax=Streptomyces mirabilis TaxID=68239 RepID=UPI0036DE3543
MLVGLGISGRGRVPAGAVVGQRPRPRRARHGGRLTVRMKSAAWATILRLGQARVISRISRAEARAQS